jgi:hypothetical protein
MDKRNCNICNVRQTTGKRYYTVEGGYVGNCLVAKNKEEEQNMTYICNACLIQLKKEAKVTQMNAKLKLTHIVCLYV